MKMRKLTAFIVAMVAFLATFSFIPTFNVRADEPASGEEIVEPDSGSETTPDEGAGGESGGDEDVEVDKHAENVKFVAGYFYTTEYIAEKFLNTDKLDKSKSCYFSYKHETDAEYANKEDDKDVANEYCRINVKVVIGSSNGTTNSFDGKIGKYDIKFFYGEENNDVVTEKEIIATSEFNIVETPSSDEEAPKYVEDKEAFNKAFADYNDALIKELKGKDDKGKDLDASFSFNLSDDKYLEALFSSEYYDYKALSKEYWYSKPSSTSFTKTTSSTFQLSEVGEYCFYILAKDPNGNGLKVDPLNDGESFADDKVRENEDNKDKAERKIVDGIEGWYKYTGDAEAFDEEKYELIAPIFTFTFTLDDQTNHIKITSEDKVDPGFKGLMYKGAKSYFTVVNALKPDTEYKLYYSKDRLDKKEGENDETFAETLEANATNISDPKEFKDIGFDESTLYFTPFTDKNIDKYKDKLNLTGKKIDSTGYYYIVCDVCDNTGYTAVSVTAPIAVEETFKKVKKYPEIWKNYKLSIIFLSIAVLSFIGIIVLFFVKPKEKVEEDVKDVAKK